MQEGNNTEYLLTKFGATSPTSGGIHAKKDIHYNSISLKSYVNNLRSTAFAPNHYYHDISIEDSHRYDIPSHFLWITQVCSKNSRNISNLYGHLCQARARISSWLREEILWWIEIRLKPNIGKKSYLMITNLGWRCSIILTCVVVLSPMCQSISMLAPPEGLTMVWYPSSTLWEAVLGGGT